MVSGERSSLPPLLEGGFVFSENNIFHLEKHNTEASEVIQPKLDVDCDQQRIIPSFWSADSLPVCDKFASDEESEAASLPGQETCSRPGNDEQPVSHQTDISPICLVHSNLEIGPELAEVVKDPGQEELFLHQWLNISPENITGQISVLK